jgi:hypothetical protein
MDPKIAYLDFSQDGMNDDLQTLLKLPYAG